MRLLFTLLFAFLATTYAFPETHLLQSRKDKNGTTADGSSIKKTCKSLNKMQKLVDLANNQTELDNRVAKGKLTTAEVAGIKAEASVTAVTLEALRANSTLAEQCDVRNANKAGKKDCKELKKVTKKAALGEDEAALEKYVAKKGLNKDEVVELEGEIEEAMVRLAELQGNATLIETCAQRQAEKDAKKKDKKGKCSCGVILGTQGNLSEARKEASLTKVAIDNGAGAGAVRTVSSFVVPAVAAVFVVFL